MSIGSPKSCECGGVNPEGSERRLPKFWDAGPGGSSSEGNMASDSASSEEEEIIWESPSGSGVDGIWVSLRTTACEVEQCNIPDMLRF